MIPKMSSVKECQSSPFNVSSKCGLSLSINCITMYDYIFRREIATIVQYYENLAFGVFLSRRHRKRLV